MPRRPDVWVRASENSGHVGAVLAEAALQAGLNYEAVVVPRVKRFVKDYPAAAKVSGLTALLASGDVAVVLGIKNARKCQTFSDLARLLTTEGVETAEQFRAWLERGDSRAKLLRVPGVGVKTAAYVRLLVGLPAIAIDVHLRRAASQVGVVGSDEELERLYTLAAAEAGIALADLDGSLWQQGSDSSKLRRQSR
jgi:hypothetical protein